jgi:thioredoxin 1
LALEATDATFEDVVLGSEGKVIVDFWAEWCGPCHAVAPVLDRIADEHDDVKIVKVNVDNEQGLAQRYGVSSIPLMVLFEKDSRGPRPSSAAEERARAGARA